MNTFTTNEVLLRIDGVWVVYDGTVIIRDINAVIHNIVRPDVAVTPQIVAFIGPSGSGKSTLNRVMSGLELPTRGRVLLNEEGHPVTPGLVGVVPQNYRLFPFLTVIDILILAGRQGGMTKKAAREKALAYLDRFGLSGCAKKFASQLSGGQKQRISIFEQLLCSTRFLLADEPFANLDPDAKDQMAKLIWEVMSENEFNTCIITSHDVRTTLRLADRVWVLGKQHDPDGMVIPGSTILRDINLAEMDLAWHPDVHRDPRFRDLEDELIDLYPKIKG